MDAEMLARMQFGIALGVHYIFPQTTLGLTLVVVFSEWRHFVTGSEAWKKISAILVRFLGVVFAFGVATGMVIPFSIGMNWGNFSLFAAPVFGTQLAIESMVAFTLEAGFLGILLFGRNRVSKGLYLTAACMVFLGSHISAFLIISANSWLQYPVGYAIENGQMVLKDWWAVTFNPTAGVRFLHTVTGAWIAGCFFVLAVSARLIAQNRERELSKRMFRTSAVFVLVLGLIQPVLGHSQIMDVLEYQPVKDAAYEGIFESQNGAPLIGFGIPDAANKRIIMPLSIPKGLSFLESGNPDSHVKGLNDFPADQWPPVNVIFTTFHIMVPMAGIILAVAVFALWYTRKKEKKPLEERGLFLTLAAFGVLAPYVANEVGWIGAEIGRQPWTVYGVLLTKDATTAAQGPITVSFHLVLFVAIYIVLLPLFFKFLSATIKSVPKASA